MFCIRSKAKANSAIVTWLFAVTVLTVAMGQGSALAATAVAPMSFSVSTSAIVAMSGLFGGKKDSDSKSSGSTTLSSDGGSGSGGTSDGPLSLLSFFAPQAGMWQLVPGTAFEDFRLSDQLATDLGIMGTEGSRAVLGHFTGSAYDPVSHKWYFWGGGGTSYGGNEVYELDLESLTVTMISQPSLLEDVVLGSDSIACDIPLDAPSAGSTYDGIAWSPATQTFIVIPTGNFCPDTTVEQTSVWEFDPVLGSWTRITVPGEIEGYASSAYDPAMDQFVVITGGLTRRIFDFDPVTGQYSTPIDLGQAPGTGSAVLHPVWDALLTVSAEGISSVPLGTLGTVSALAALPAGAPATSGAIYEDARGLLILWGGDKDVWSLDPETLEWTHFPNVDGPTMQGGGVFSKWVYIEELDLFAGFNNADEGLWLYRLPDSALGIGGTLSIPVADAGPNQSVLKGETVGLDGRASFDPDGNPLSFNWEMLSRPAGSGATIVNPLSSTPSFVADVLGTYTIRLTVGDGLLTAQDTVEVSGINGIPVAEAGAGQTVNIGDTVTLDGSGSSDPDGDSLTFSWRFASLPAGSTATIPDPTAVSPMFVADIAGTFIAELLVNDGLVQSTADTVTIAAIDPDAVGSTICNPTITWGTGGDFDPANGDTLQEAQATLPNDSVSTLGIMPGYYKLSQLVWVNPGKGSVTICGIGPGRPVLDVTGSGGNISFGDILSGTVRNLELIGGGITTRNRNWLNLTVENVFIHDYIGNCILTGKVDQPATVVLTDVEVARCGSGNVKHNIYLSTRSGSVTATRVTSYAANESHAFKTTFPNVTIKDSYFSTVEDWSNPGNGPWSTTLVDIAACAQVVITGSHLKGTRTTAGRGSLRFLHYRARRSIKGCDMPLYDSAEFNDPAFWAQVSALPVTDAANPHTFKHFVSGTTLEWVDTDGTTKTAGITDDGTYPRSDDPSLAFTGCSAFLSSPAGWVERSTNFTGNINWIGFTNRHMLNFTECKHALTDPDAVYPTPPRTLTSVGGEDGSTVALPSWFRTN